MRVLVAVMVVVALVNSDAWAGDKVSNRFELGQKLYAVGRYSEALATFEAARKLAPRPEFDLSIARCYERLSDWPNAIAAYTRYIETTPTPLDADMVLVHIGELRDKLATAPPPAVVTEPAPIQRQPDSPRGRGMFVAGAVLAGVGLAALGAGIGMGVAGDQAADAATARDRAGSRYDPAQDQQITTDRIAQGVLLGVGAVAVVTGVVLLAVGKRASSRYAWVTSAGVRF